MKTLKLFFIVFVIIILSTSCNDSIDNSENLYAFNSQSITEYINNQPDLSMFAKTLQISKISIKGNSSSVASLLGSRGNFTAFVPNNKAIKSYLDSIYGQNNYNIDTLPEKVANNIVLNCIMDFGNAPAFKEIDLYEGTIQEPTLNDCNFLVKQENYGNGIFTKVNNGFIIKHDIELNNGYIEIVDQVIKPSPQTISGLIAQNDSLTIFSKLLELTSWGDSMLAYRDRHYVCASNNFPKNRFYGYTVFTEPDRIFYEKWGIPLLERDTKDGHIKNWNTVLTSISQKCKQTYTDATKEDWTSPDNAVNQFVAYHLVDGKYPIDELARYSKQYDDWKTKDIQSFYCTKGKYRRLLKVTRIAKTGSMMLNRHCYYNNTFDGDYREIACDITGAHIQGDKQTYGYNYARNGYFFTIDDILLYSEQVQKIVLNDRIRYGVTGYLPELKHLESIYPNGCLIPIGYCENLITDDNYGYEPTSKMAIEGKLLNFSGSSNKGVQDFILKLMPVPFAGNWQVRTNYNIITPYDEINQIYIGDSKILNKLNPIGLPTRNFERCTEELAKIFKNDYQLGKDSITCLENDKQLYLHGFMKGPKFFHYHEASDGHIYDNNNTLINSSNYTMRDKAKKSRRIIYEGYMEPNKIYYIRVHMKMGQSSQISTGYRIPLLDMIELVPESVYDNPNKAEDIW